MALTAIMIDKEKCNGCRTCIDTCPAAVYEIKEDKSEPVHPEECLQCEACVTLCPNSAITLNKI